MTYSVTDGNGLSQKLSDEDFKYIKTVNKRMKRSYKNFKLRWYTRIVEEKPQLRFCANSIVWRNTRD